jgi:hypothetical protein
VALQRKMADEYDRREKTRKVRSDFTLAGSRRRARRPARAPARPAARGHEACAASDPVFPPLFGPQLREIKTVCPDVTDEEALAALEDKGGKCVPGAAPARGRSDRSRAARAMSAELTVPPALPPLPPFFGAVRMRRLLR